MRPSPRAVTLSTIALCLLTVLASLNGSASAQAEKWKRKLSRNFPLSSQPQLNGVPPATTDTWTGTGSNADWSNASNWNGGAITSGENILINLTTAATTDDAAFTIGTLTLSNAGDSVGINNGIVLTVEGNISNAGTISLNSAGFGTDLIINGNVTLSGTGKLTMSNNADNFILGTTALNQLTNQETIQGSGTIGDGKMALVNSGTINANQSTTLFVDPNSGLTNTGTLEATSGGTLQLLNMGTGNTGTVNNLGGTISANGGTVQIFNSVINGGNVTLSGTSSLQLSNGTVLGATITNSATGTIELVSGTNVLGGTINNSAGGILKFDNGAVLDLAGGTYSQLGTVQMNSAGFGTDLILQGNVTLSGGTVTMSNNADNFILGQATSDTLTNQETISGSGNIGDAKMTLVNSGTINANQATTLFVDANGGITNTGTLEATSGGILQILNSTVTNAGGTISANGSTLQITGTTINGGAVTLTGASSLQLSTATIHGGSTLTNSATGTIELVSGTNTLGGTINNSAGGILKLDNGAVLNLEGGTYAQLGTVQLNSAGFGTDLFIDGNVTLSGGSITMTNNADNFILGQATGDTLTNQETISGSGNIGDAKMTLVNSGTINANQSTTLFVNATGGVTNTGTLEATNGATMQLLNTTVNNAGGTISANGSTLQVSGTTINGGTVTLTGASSLQLTNATIHGGSTLTNSATGTIELTSGTNTLGGTVNNSAGGILKLDNGAVLNLEGGTYSQLGTVQMNSAGFGTDIVLEGSVILSGGSVTLTNNADNFIVGATSTDTLTNQETISGSGNIGDGKMRLANSGTINANQSTTLFVDANSGIANSGTLEATGGGTMQLLNSTVINSTGTISANSSTLQVDGTTISGGNVTLTGAANLQLSSATIHGGTLTNSSTGNIELQSGINDLGGTINNSAGGILKLDNGSVLDLEAGTYSQLGTVQLNSAGFGTDLVIEGNVTLSGGSITMSANANNAILGAFSADVLTNKETIQGAGLIGNGGMGLVNTGTINANASGNLLINVSNQNFNNTGGIVEASGATLTIEGPGATFFSNDNESTNTLTGGTYIANGANILWNHGSSAGITTLAASVTEENGGTLVNTFNGANTNMLTGLTSITSAGSLTIGGAAFTDAGSFSNAGSLTILAGESFTVGSLSQISGSSLTAGTYVLDANLNLSGTAQTITTNAATLTLAGGTIENTSNSTNALAGLATNSGKLTIGGAGNNVSTTAATFSNTGTLTINGGDSFTAAKLTQISSTTLSAGTFVLGGNLDLTTAGITIATNSATLTLQGGTINSNGVNALALTSNTKSLTLANNANYTTATTGNFTNTGTVTINSGSTLTVGGTSHSYKQTAGTTTVDGTLSGGTTGSASFTGGTLQGAGTILGNASVGNTTGTAVTINVGDSGKAGLLAITGTYTQLATATMKASIGGLTTGTYSELTVSGTANLGGTLSVAIVNGLVLTASNLGTQFTILSSTGTLSGTFTNSSVTSGSDVFSVSYVGNTVVLTLTSVTGAKGSTALSSEAIAASTTKTLVTSYQNALSKSNLKRGISGGARKIPRPILFARTLPPRLRGGAELNNMRGWDGPLPITVNPVHALPVASLASTAGENSSRLALPIAPARIGRSGAIGVQSPLSGWTNNSNTRRTPLSPLRPVIPHLAR